MKLPSADDIPADECTLQHTLPTQLEVACGYTRHVILAFSHTRIISTLELHTYVSDGGGSTSFIVSENCGAMVSMSISPPPCSMKVALTGSLPVNIASKVPAAGPNMVPVFAISAISALSGSGGTGGGAGGVVELGEKFLGGVSSGNGGGGGVSVPESVRALASGLALASPRLSGRYGNRTHESYFKEIKIPISTMHTCIYISCIANAMKQITNYRNVHPSSPMKYGHQIGIQSTHNNSGPTNCVVNTSL